MSIVIFGDLFSFPEGKAATNRVYTYAKGLIENGAKVHVVVFTNDYLPVPNGVADGGIPYYHPFGRTKRSNSFFARRWYKINKYFQTYRILKKIHREEKITVINSWTLSFSAYLMAWFHARLFGAKLVTERSEHPMRAADRHNVHKKKSLQFNIETYLCDGIICISRFLVDFYKSKNVADTKLLMVPSTVDPSRFELNGTKKPIAEQYVGYFGSLTFRRDNVDMLIKGFGSFSPNHPNVRLVLGGFYPEEPKEEFLTLIRENGIELKVDMVDFLTRKEIQEYIIHADVLVMTRTNDLDALASYPSKLTEFLATGKPVISVNVGEIPDFLTDGENGYLVPPGDDRALANKLDYIFNNYESARQVGQKGKELTNTIFNYNYQAKRILTLLRTSEVTPIPYRYLPLLLLN